MQQSRTDGFTLIELLLYVSIVGSLLIAVSLFLGLSLDARVKSQTVTEVDQQGTAALEYIASTVRNASAVTTPAPGATTNILAANGATTTTFSVASNALQVQEASTTTSLTNDKVTIQNLQFTNLARSGTHSIIQISFTISRVNPSGTNAYDYTKTFTTSAEVRQ